MSEQTPEPVEAEEPAATEEELIDPDAEAPPEEPDGQDDGEDPEPDVEPGQAEEEDNS